MQNGKMEAFADYLKTKYAHADDSVSPAGAAKPEPADNKHRPPQYGYLMAQFKNPDAVSPSQSLRIEGDDISISNLSMKTGKRTSQSSLTESAWATQKPATRPLPRIMTLRERVEANALESRKLRQEREKEQKTAAASSVAAAGTGENPHLIEVMVLCDRIHKLEEEMRERGKQAEKLAAELKEERVVNQALREENERLKRAAGGTM